MKKTIIFGFLLIAVIFTAYSLDPEKARRAVTEQNYIPALIDYGFTEQQIRAWRTVGSTLTNYLTELNRNGRLARRDATSMTLQMCVLNREITENEKTRIDQFLIDIESFWLSELSRADETRRQGVQAAEAQREQDRLRWLLEQEQYAQSFGLDNAYGGIFNFITNVNSENFERARRRMIIPENPDQAFAVRNIIDDYVIYSMTVGSRLYEVALLPESGKSYPVNSQIDVNSVYKVEGIQRFNRAYRGTADLIVISRLGPMR